tara:strand:- start:6642 stop:6905 length:264 start_codon:yes stop_codon:yes gene_type:complete
MQGETYIILFVMLGIFFISLHRMKYSCPPARIEYRYIKREFDEYQDNPVEINEMMTGLFETKDLPKTQQRNKTKQQDHNTSPFSNLL